MLLVLCYYIFYLNLNLNHNDQSHILQSYFQCVKKKNLLILLNKGAKRVFQISRITIP